MCTITCWRSHQALRVVHTRDERRDRGPALAPRVFAGERPWLAPCEADGGGTWVAVNADGLVLAMLNRSEPGDREPAPQDRRSRGAIIPELARSCGDHASVDARLGALPLQHWPPFRLLVIDQRATRVATWDGHDLRRGALSAATWQAWFSSSLGDGLVQEPRARAFAAATEGAVDPAAAQDAFHRLRWPDAGHLAPCMDRADAVSRSCTWIDIDGGAICLLHREGAPDDEAVPRTGHRLDGRSAVRS